jgi:hypothetical protein
MANYRRTATGNWSTLAQWQDDSSGSYVASTVLPSVADVVYANNFTVTLDIDVTVLELRTTTAPNINIGGRFDYGAGCNTVIGNTFASNGTCLRNNLTTTKNYIGNAVGGGASGTSPFAVENSSTGTIVMVGNVTGGSGGNQPWGVVNSGLGSFNITGNVTAGSAGPGAVNFGNGVMTIIGSAIGNNGGSSVGANNNGSGIMYIDTAIASSTASGVNGASSGGDTVIKQIINNANGRLGVLGFIKLNNTGPNSFIGPKQNGTTQTLVDSSIGNPATADVRNGVTYASGALTGTLVVPSPSNVRQGVPTDNTVGTAALTPADFWDYLTSGATPGSMGARVAAIPTNPASVESTGAQIASFNT